MSTNSSRNVEDNLGCPQEEEEEGDDDSSSPPPCDMVSCPPSAGGHNEEEEEMGGNVSCSINGDGCQTEAKVMVPLTRTTTTATRKKPNKKSLPKKGANPSSFSSIQTIHSAAELQKLFQADHQEGAAEVVVVLEFMTSWCGACQSIADLYEQLAAQSVALQQQQKEEEGATKIVAAQVYCDDNNSKNIKKLMATHGVTSYPVFVVLQNNGQVIQKWNGADRGKLEKAFEKYSSSSPNTTKKKGSGGSKKKQRGRQG